MSQLKQFKERRGYHGIKRIKTFENEKENQYQGRRARFQLPVKVALDIDFIDEQEVQFNVLAAKKYACR